MAQYFTAEGLKKIKEELKHLKTVEIIRITKLIKEAAAFGDLKENSAYHDARNMKSFVLGQIEQLENAVVDAIVVEKKEGGAVQVDSQVKILFGGVEENYRIVTSTQADVLNNKISYQSPLGQELMGKKVKDEFNYEVKGKKIKIKILSIS